MIMEVDDRRHGGDDDDDEGEDDPATAAFKKRMTDRIRNLMKGEVSDSKLDETVEYLVNQTIEAEAPGGKEGKKATWQTLVQQLKAGAGRLRDNLNRWHPNDRTPTVRWNRVLQLMVPTEPVVETTLVGEYPQQSTQPQ